MCVNGYMLLRHLTCLCHLCHQNSISSYVACFHTEHFGQRTRLIEQEKGENAISIFKKELDVEVVKKPFLIMDGTEHFVCKSR